MAVIQSRNNPESKVKIRNCACAVAYFDFFPKKKRIFLMQYSVYILDITTLNNKFEKMKKFLNLYAYDVNFFIFQNKKSFSY